MNPSIELHADATYRDVTDAWRALRGTADARVREVACVGAPRTLLCVELGEPDRPCIALSAGVHGDEPAGVAALVALVFRRMLPADYSYRIWPCLNPTGFDARTRASVDGADINRTFGRGGSSPEAKGVIVSNRDRKFALSIDLHEDDEAEAPYAYAYGGTSPLLSQGTAFLEPDPEAEATQLGGRSYTLLLVRNASPRAITLETPSTRPFDERVMWHASEVQSILRRLRCGS